MERIKKENLNSPAEFNRLWHGDMAANRRQFDLYRFRALMEGIKGRVIELGCGCSEFLSFASNHHPEIKATGLDYSRFAIEYMAMVDPRIEWVLGDALRTGVDKDLFDFVISGELIEHLEEPPKLVAEMKRICKVGGTVRISTLLPHLQATDPYHIWKFSEQDLEGFFKVVGPVTVTTVGNYFIVSAVKA